MVKRCSPLSSVRPKRYSEPGIRFEDLPPVDVVLVSHNHYDHFDIPTLKGLVKRGTLRAIVPLGNLDLMRSTGIAAVDELDWWQWVPMSSNVTITLVPAQHFRRALWHRDRTLWGGFVISGPSGNVYYAGDTGYGPHFREIARRFSPIRVAILPIAHSGRLRPRTLIGNIAPFSTWGRLRQSKRILIWEHSSALLPITRYFVWNRGV